MYGDVISLSFLYRRSKNNDGLSCIIRTIDKKNTLHFFTCFTRYSNDLFPCWWSYWLVLEKIEIEMIRDFHLF